MGNQYTPSSIMATYVVKILQRGSYVLWGRISAVNGKDNSFFVQIENGSDYLWEVETGKRWHWDLVNDRYKTDPVKFILDKGKHSIKIKLREDGTRLDKMLLTNDMDYIPNNKEDLGESAGYVENY
jgi:hypothetical protein